MLCRPPLYLLPSPYLNARPVAHGAAEQVFPGGDQATVYSTLKFPNNLKSLAKVSGTLSWGLNNPALPLGDGRAGFTGEMRQSKFKGPVLNFNFMSSVYMYIQESCQN